ncbi:MAG: hypothetical protein L3J06_04140 [Cyclobacteriaceae bacterium]|nr:hypothetical protein [Cyclobacteriaceae bacterium]
MHKLLLLLLAIILSGFSHASNPKDSVKATQKAQPVLLNNFNTKVNLSVLDKFKLQHTPHIAPKIEEVVFMPQDTSNFANYINNISKKVIETNKLIDNLTPEDLVSLPVGIVKTIGVAQYVIIIDSVQYTATGNPTISAYISIKVPSSNTHLAFAGKGIEFHPGGILAGNSTKLVLVSNHRIPLGQKIDMVLEAKAQNNYVEWNCQGFKSINLGGKFEFSRDVIIPDKENSTEKVTAGFEVNATDFRNMLIGVSLEKFKLSKLKDISIEVTEAWMDFSDVRNPIGMSFPKDYATNKQNTVLWEGFYMKALTVYLPKSLTGEKGVDKEIKIENAIIDNMGFSGSASITNLLSKKNGNLKNWPFSIDYLQISLVKNRVKAAKMKGELTLPLFKDDPLIYSALIRDNNGFTDYTFTFSPAGTLDAKIFMAKVELERNSVIKIEKIKGEFIASAVLNGNLSVNAPMGNSGSLNWNKITFQQLSLTTEKPNLRGGIFGLGSGNQGIANFPLSITALGFRNDNNKVIFTASVAINFMKASDKGFAGFTTIDLVGNMESSPIGEESFTYERPKWKFEKVVVKSVRIDVKSEVFSIAGQVDLYEKDATYGTGFRGALAASFKGIQVEAVAQFGKIEQTRYWYVDAMVSAGVAPIAPLGPSFGIYAFRGGMYYHMSREEIDETSTTTTVNTNTTRSGVRYIPDPSIGIGFKAGITLATTPFTSTFNADAMFEMNFNTRGGVNEIKFYGEGYFLTAMDKGAENSPMYAILRADYDLSASSFHGSLKTYVKFGSVLQGIGENGLAGNAVIHFEPSTWYIHVGRPDQQIGLKIGGLAEAKAYFMLGDDIPPFPGLPDYMREVAGDFDTNFMRNENMIASGRGIAFGASLNVDTGKKRFLIFYGRFHAGLGFDIMLKDYGNVTCAGRSGAIGMNGWYASGQAWALLQGSVGVYVNLKFVKGEFDIASFNAGTILQAKLPNPTWVSGKLFGNFKILGGLVKGQFNYEITIGEECNFVGGSAVDGIEIIAELTPEKEATDVSVYTAPQVAFNIAIDTPFEMMDYNNNVKAYKVVLDYFDLYNGASKIQANKIWNDGNDVIILKTHELLPSEANLSAKVKVHWEEKINGVWKPLEFEGKTEYEDKIVSFNSGVRPNTIEERNVLYNYPLTAQNHFYINETGAGYVQLDYDQGYLFPATENEVDWEYKGRYIQNGQPAGIMIPLTYSASSKRATFSIPNGLIKEKQYAFEIVKVPKTYDNVADKNVIEKDKELSILSDLSVKSEVKELEGDFMYADEKVLYSTYFAISKYATFKEKFELIEANKNMYSQNIDGYNLRQLNFVYHNVELFDELEIQGNSTIEPLIRLEATTDNAWFRDFLNYNIYSYYPANNEFKITWRTQEEFDIGIPPLKALRVKENSLAKLSKPNWDINQPLLIDGYLKFEYIMSYFSYFDYKELKDKAYNKYTNNYGAAPAGIKRLLQSTSYQYIYGGRYGIKVAYYLPGATSPSSTVTTYIDY